MDLLTGYGSASDSDDDVGPPPAAVSHEEKPRGLFGSLPKPKGAAAGSPAGFFDSTSSPAAAHASARPAPAAPALPADFFDTRSVPSASPAAQQQEEEDGGPAAAAPPPTLAGLADLPQPSDTQLWSKLPAPRTAAAKRKVMFRPQINLELLAASDSDEEDTAAARAAKKARQEAVAGGGAAAGKPSVLSFLPAPKHAGLQRGGGALGGTRLDTGAGSSSSGAGSSGKPPLQPQTGSKGAGGATAGAAAPAALGNEAYRLHKPPASAAAAAAGGGSGHPVVQPAVQQYQQQQYSYAEQQQYAAAYSGQVASGRGAGAAAAAAAAVKATYLPPEEALLQEALQAEASKAARRSAGAGSSQLLMPSIQFKEVNADAIKYVNPAQREAAQGARAALGADYAAQLRGAAAPHVGSKLARSKHQIGTLFANAKLQELEMLEKRASGMKSKAETAGKYGW